MQTNNVLDGVSRAQAIIESAGHMYGPVDSSTIAESIVTDFIHWAFVHWNRSEGLTEAASREATMEVIEDLKSRLVEETENEERLTQEEGEESGGEEDI